MVLRRKSTCLGRREGRKFSLIGLSCVAGDPQPSIASHSSIHVSSFLSLLFEGADQEESGERLMRSSQSYHTLPHPQVPAKDTFINILLPTYYSKGLPHVTTPETSARDRAGSRSFPAPAWEQHWLFCKSAFNSSSCWTGFSHVQEEQTEISRTDNQD